MVAVPEIEGAEVVALLFQIRQFVSVQELLSFNIAPPALAVLPEKVQLVITAEL